MKVVVYSLDDNVCIKCRATKLALDSKGIPYEVVRLDENPDAMSYIKSVVGDKTQAPVVVVDYGDGVTATWSDFRIDRIKKLAADIDATAA